MLTMQGMLEDLAARPTCGGGVIFDLGDDELLEGWMLSFWGLRPSM